MTRRLADRAIEQAHLTCLTARQDVAVADDPSEPPKDRNGRPTGPSPHHQLQKSVSLYYEALRSALVSTPEGRRYFHGETPDGPKDQGGGVLRRFMSEREVEIESLPNPPEDTPSLKAEQFYEDAIAEMLRDDQVLLRPVQFDTDREDPVAVARIEEYQAGLSLLDDMHLQRKEVSVDNDSQFGTGDGFFPSNPGEQETEKRIVLRPLRVLMNAARELDRSAVELDLLADTAESDVQPYMRDFDASNGEPESEMAQAEMSGTPDM